MPEKSPFIFPWKKKLGQRTSVINKPKIGNVDMTTRNIMG
jgi:hypothetical protein